MTELNLLIKSNIVRNVLKVYFGKPEIGHHMLRAFCRICISCIMMEELLIFKHICGSTTEHTA